MFGALFMAVCWLLGARVDCSPWSTWWAYKGVAGPNHWGYLNPEWLLCRSGKFQSPINVRPRMLLFDPNLQHVKMDLPAAMDGVLKNTGNDLTFVFENLPRNGANFSKGPLLYEYRATQIKIHIGKSNSEGSEHKIDGKIFAAEIQILCFNNHLFKTFQQAKKKPYGVAILAIMAELAKDSDSVNGPFRILASTSTKIPNIGQKVSIEGLDLRGLIPQTNYYVTYEGSFTQPGCYETVTWVIFNKPIFIQEKQLDTIRQLQKHQEDKRMTFLDGNVRPEQPRNNRALRTNINFPNSGGLCSMKRITYYQANEGIVPTRERKNDEGGH